MPVDSQSGATNLNSSYNRGMIEVEEGRKAGLCAHGVTIRRRKFKADTFK